MFSLLRISTAKEEKKKHESSQAIINLKEGDKGLLKVTFVRMLDKEVYLLISCFNMTFLVVCLGNLLRVPGVVR